MDRTAVWGIIAEIPIVAGDLAQRQIREIHFQWRFTGRLRGAEICPWVGTESLGEIQSSARTTFTGKPRKFIHRSHQAIDDFAGSEVCVPGTHERSRAGDMWGGHRSTGFRTIRGIAAAPGGIDACSGGEEIDAVRSEI